MIRLRGRPEQQAVPASYVKRLNQLYEEWIPRYDHFPTLVLATDKMNYVTDLVDRWTSSRPSRLICKEAAQYKRCKSGCRCFIQAVFNLTMAWMKHGEGRRCFI